MCLQALNPTVGLSSPCSALHHVDVLPLCSGGGNAVIRLPIVLRKRASRPRIGTERGFRFRGPLFSPKRGSPFARGEEGRRWRRPRLNYCITPPALPTSVRSHYSVNIAFTGNQIFIRVLCPPQFCRSTFTFFPRPSALLSSARVTV